MMRSLRTLSRPASQALPSPSAAASSSSLRAMPMPGHLAKRAQQPRMMASMPSRQALFSTSSRAAAPSDAEADKSKAKETEEKVVGETLGAKEGEAAGGEAAKQVEELQAKIKEKDAKIKDLTDAVLYGKADLQNAQRRATEEKSQAGDYAITKFARDLTASLDILALALRSVPEALRTAPADVTSLEDPRKAVAELYSGVDLTSKSIMDMLKQHGVTSFDPTGEKFNPQEHEAMFQAPVPGKEPGTVLECSKVGFKIKDRVLRAAQVGIVQQA